MLNVVLFGKTAEQWKEGVKSRISSTGNMLEHSMLECLQCGKRG